MGDVDARVIELGSRIQKYRKKRMMSQQELGMEVGSNANSIYLYETGQRVMKVDKLFQIAEVLGIEAGMLCPKEEGYREKLCARVECVGKELEMLDGDEMECVIAAAEAMIAGYKSEHRKG